MDKGLGNEDNHEENHEDDEEELDNVSGLNNSGSDELELSMISKDPEDDHEFLEVIEELDPPEDTISSQNRTDNESFQTTDHFPSSSLSISDMSSMHLDNSNNRARGGSFGGGKRTRKTRNHKKTKKNRKTKKVKKNKVTKKSKKIKGGRSRKLRFKKNYAVDF